MVTAKKNEVKKVLVKKVVKNVTGITKKDWDNLMAGRAQAHSNVQGTGFMPPNLTDQSYKQKAPLLHRAEELINGDRQKDYGDKLQNFAQISMLWQGTLAHKLMPGEMITAEDVALCMIQVKIARLAKSPDHEDSVLDIAGYIGCHNKLQEERKNGAKLKGNIADFRNPEDNAPYGM